MTDEHESEDVIPDALVPLLRNARHIVVFTGAGVSAESGIPTFRDALSGLWERFDATQLATRDAFRHDPDLVWGWYEWRRMSVMRASPNAARFSCRTRFGLIKTFAPGGMIWPNSPPSLLCQSICIAACVNASVIAASP